MSDVFEVGHKVRYRGEEVTVTYGPYTSALGLTRYLVKDADGAEMPARNSEIYAIPTPPAFAVGDEVTYEYGGGGKLVAGPFKSEHHGEPLWVVEKPNGTHMTPTENSLTKVEAPAVKVGDRVRVVKDDPRNRTGEYVGKVGILASDYSSDGDSLPYIVRFGDGTGRHGDEVNGKWCVAEVEPITDEDTYEHGGVVYDLTAKYRDNEGDVWCLARTGDRVTAGCHGESPSTSSFTLAYVVERWGPLTRVTD
ncbi:phiSA1p31-related protein [Streptomyces sp. NPDC033538]|uniref:phiSA1p31-related protein n=1 Tax=Streptomyces sp. NPDC033538 TaxID=3155367 RepID=UPI0033C674D4